MGQAVITRRGGGKKLPALTNPATAAQIFKGYQGIDSEGLPIEGAALATAISAAVSHVTKGKTFYNEKGELEIGTMTPYYYQTASKKITTARTTTFTATGSTLLMAIATLSTTSSLSNAEGDPGVIIGTQCLTDRVGHSIGSKYSVSGNVISIYTSENDVADFEDPYLLVYIVSK